MRPGLEPALWRVSNLESGEASGGGWLAAGVALAGGALVWRALAPQSSETAPRTARAARAATSAPRVPDSGRTEEAPRPATPNATAGIVASSVEPPVVARVERRGRRRGIVEGPSDAPFTVSSLPPIAIPGIEAPVPIAVAPIETTAVALDPIAFDPIELGPVEQAGMYDVSRTWRR
jgi:hypothetical protein